MHPPIHPVITRGRTGGVNSQSQPRATAYLSPPGRRHAGSWVWTPLRVPDNPAPLHLGAHSNARETLLPCALDAAPAAASPWCCPSGTHATGFPAPTAWGAGQAPRSSPARGRTYPRTTAHACPRVDGGSPRPQCVPCVHGSTLAGCGLDGLAPCTPVHVAVLRLPRHGPPLCCTPGGQKLRARLANCGTDYLPIDRAVARQAAYPSWRCGSPSPPPFFIAPTATVAQAVQTASGL